MAALEEQGDIMLAEIQPSLADYGINTGIGTLWRFFERHGITRRKGRARDRVGSSRHIEAASAVVQRTARSGTGAPRVYRRGPGLPPT